MSNALWEVPVGTQNKKSAKFQPIKNLTLTIDIIYDKTFGFKNHAESDYKKD